MPEKLGPLGLLSEKSRSIDKIIIAKLEYIEKFDLSVQKNTYVAKGRCESIHVGTIERELKRFLSLPLLLSFEDRKYDSFVPSGAVDGLWHRFILHTRDYRTFCDEVYGGYLDHNPESSKTEGLKKYSGELFSYTKLMLMEFYGAIPPFVWGDVNPLRPACDTGAPCITFG